jgi:polar amino acid transport system substrate-binding protein
MEIGHLRSGRGLSWQLRLAGAALAALALLVSACGAGNAPTTGNTTPGTVQVGNAGLLTPGVLKWGEDSTGGMPYIVPKDDNNPGSDYYGFEVDIANGFAGVMNVAQQPTQITWSNWPQGLASQQFDMFMNGLEISSDNVKSAMFSIPYYVYTQSIVVLNTNTTINTFADLAGKKVETGTGYQAENVMDDYNSKNPSNKITIVTTDSPTPFTDLLAGRVDAMFLDTPIAEWYGGNDPSGKFKIVGGNLDPGYYGIGFDRSNPNAKTLKAELDKAIEQLWLNGTLKKIYQTGGAFNVGPDGKAVFEKYGMWSDAELCIGNFLPDHPTNVAGCPTLAAGYGQ